MEKPQETSSVDKLSEFRRATAIRVALLCESAGLAPEDVGYVMSMLADDLGNDVSKVTDQLINSTIISYRDRQSSAR